MTNTIELYVWDDATQQWIAPLASGQELQALAQIVNNNTTIVTEFSEQVTEISGVVNDLEENFNSHTAQMKYVDTRDVNSPPSFYYAKGSGKYREFKRVSVIGLAFGVYVAIETIVPYPDVTAGKITQIAYSDNGATFKRKSVDADTWGDWVSDKITTKLITATRDLSLGAGVQRMTTQAGRKIVGAVVNTTVASSKKASWGLVPEVGEASASYIDGTNGLIYNTYLPILLSDNNTENRIGASITINDGSIDLNWTVLNGASTGQATVRLLVTYHD